MNTIDKLVYMVYNHNNNTRFITDNEDDAYNLREYWDVYGEGEAAASIISMPKAEYARCIAKHKVTTVCWTIWHSMGFPDDLPF